MWVCPCSFSCNLKILLVLSGTAFCKFNVYIWNCNTHGNAILMSFVGCSLPEIGHVFSDLFITIFCKTTQFQNLSLRTTVFHLIRSHILRIGEYHCVRTKLLDFPPGDT